MLQVVPSKDRHHENFGWLDTRWHFSFDTYHDPDNMSWGPLRVFNDDVIRPGKGFGMHPHRDMEIITYVLEGALDHRDNLGNRGAIQAGELQVMSAGSGIVHSEYNYSRQPVHLYQFWILPRTRNLKPRWEQRRFDPAQWTGKLVPVVSSGQLPETLAIDQDAVVYLSSLQGGQQVSHQFKPNRKGYLFVTAGKLDLNGTPLSSGDQARIDNEPELQLRAEQDSKVMLIDLP